MFRRIKLPFKVKKPILACGADLKGAFAFASGNEAYIVDGFGDLGDLDNFTQYETAISKYQRKLGLKPYIVACDLHPDYFSTRFAENFQLPGISCKLCRIQHHEAHIASVIADNGIKGDVIGVAFDGTGYGSDGNIWGGEFFVGDPKKFKRVAHLEYIQMPGGEKAISQPWRMAASYVYRAFGNKFPRSLTKRWRAKDLAIVKAMIDKGINSPLTSSAGRLFDAAGSLVLAKDVISKEAELPIELERLSSGSVCGGYGFDILSGKEGYIIDTFSVIREVVKEMAKKSDKSLVACKFHNTIADIILKVSLRLRRRFKLDRVVLSGGVFQNKLLSAKAVKALTAHGLKVYTHSGVSTNDSGIPIGQIAIANARATCV